MIKRFGEKLHLLRTERKLTLKELATLLGLSSHGYLSELESGKKLPSVEFLISITRLFNVTSDSLIHDALEIVYLTTHDYDKETE